MSRDARVLHALEELEPTGVIRSLEQQVGTVVRGKPEVIRLAVVCLLARGHILIEDVPGVGKTTLAQALARSLGVEFQRIQFTSDLLPSDIIGVSIFNQRSQQFQFSPGPIFSNVVLADEINRASPKTQSALLEAMSEGRVTVDRIQHPLPSPFLVLATQNPLEHHGTFPLPESQLDRFLMTLEIGYPAREEERDLLLSGGVDETLETLSPALDAERLSQLQRSVPRIRVAEKLVDYMIDIAEATRSDSRFLLGASTRGVQGLCRAAQALALYQGRDFAIPDDVRTVAASVLGHRVVLRRQRDGTSGAEAVRQVLEEIPVPV
jgi:MoxR-like ATPase